MSNTAPHSGLRVALAGEALIDLIATQQGSYIPCLGGAVYNLARALARQAVGALYLNPLSHDRFGRSLASQLNADGVTLAQPDPVQAVTSLAVVNLDETGHPSYAFYREGVADRQISANGLNALCQQHPELDAVCTGALALDARDQAVYVPWIAHQRSLGKCIVVDANLRPSVMPDLSAYRQNIETFLRMADILKVSDEDLAHLGIPGSDPLEQARHLLERSPAQLIALTLGARGAWLITRHTGEHFVKEPYPITVADTVGAGDSFLAGLLAALLHSTNGAQTLRHRLQQLTAHDSVTLLQHAVASASLCVQQQGCVPPSWEDASEWRTQRFFD